METILILLQFLSSKFSLFFPNFLCFFFHPKEAQQNMACLPSTWWCQCDPYSRARTLPACHQTRKEIKIHHMKLMSSTVGVDIFVHRCELDTVMATRHLPTHRNGRNQSICYYYQKQQARISRCISTTSSFYWPGTGKETKAMLPYPTVLEKCKYTKHKAEQSS